MLVEAKHELLKTKLEPYIFSNLDESELIAEELVKAMRDNGGIGLAANQIGLNHRVFAMEGEPAFVCFNPKVIMPGTELVTLEETCLTFPGLCVKVKRPRDIRVRFQGPDGETYTKTLTGVSARVFQHELDHLDGIDMLRRANRIHREQALKKWKKWKQ